MKCTAISPFDKLEDTDVLKVTFDNDTQAFWMFDGALALEYLDKEVEVSFRKEIYKGNELTFINTIVEPQKVNIINKTDNIKLYTNSEDNYCNVAFRSMGIGDTIPGAIMYCVSQQFKSSEKAIWVEFVVRDKMLHTAKLRVFDYMDNKANFAGRYIMAGISKSEYGLQADAVYPANGEVPENPEITIAYNFIKDYFKDDSAANYCINNYHLLDTLKEVVTYEKGYALVQLAYELSFVQTLNNVTDSVNVQTVGHIILGSYLHYVQKQSVLSPSYLNCSMASKVHWSDVKTVLLALDETNTIKTPESIAAKRIKSLAKDLITIRKGDIDELI